VTSQRPDDVFADLDRLTGGLQPSDLIIIGARPSMGKTALSVSLAHATAMKHQTTVGIFALEMSAEQIVQRFVAIESGVDQQKLRTGNFEDRDLERIVAAAGARRQILDDLGVAPADHDVIHHEGPHQGGDRSVDRLSPFGLAQPRQSAPSQHLVEVPLATSPPPPASTASPR